MGEIDARGAHDGETAAKASQTREAMIGATPISDGPMYRVANRSWTCSISDDMWILPSLNRFALPEFSTRPSNQSRACLSERDFRRVRRRTPWQAKDLCRCLF